MNWEVVSNTRSSLQEFRLIDNNVCKLVIKYNPLHQSARISSGTHHRLFYLESAGSLSGKTVFRNEYGTEIGTLLHDKFQPKEGSVVIDSKKYKYHLQNSPSPELIIYENDLQNPVATCSIPPNNSNQKFFSISSEAIDNNCYLLGLSWYLSLPVIKENIQGYASAHN
ncbi:MAG: hypothetical protein ABIN01_04420 [Ferruginibacter sp.]